MNCEQCNVELLAYVRDELSPERREAVENHLARCAECRANLEKARRVLEWTTAASDEAVQRQTEELIQQAIRANASDIHFEPLKNGELLVRNRVDGVLHEVARIPSPAGSGVITRLKMLSDMNVAEAALPQDGRMDANVDDRPFDLRVTAVPFIHGQGMIIRILDRTSVLVGLDHLGMAEWHVQALRDLVHRPNGMVLVGGPTGSGKTTLLYSMVLEVDRQANKVLTVEDPVEYILEGCSQLQVNKTAGLSFVRAMRAFLRSDPDVIMCGEVRDRETAVLSAEAALTGHLLMASIHINHAVDAIQRLRDMEMQDFLMAAALAGVTCQRLVRKTCQSCSEPWTPNPDEPALRHLGITPSEAAAASFRRPKGCDACNGSGFKGRSAILEILTISRTLRAMIGQGASGGQILEQARAEGFISMREDAKRLVLEGITTIEEAARVTA